MTKVSTLQPLHCSKRALTWVQETPRFCGPGQGAAPNSFLDQGAVGTAGCQTLIFLTTDPGAKDTLLALASPSFVSGHCGKRQGSLDLGSSLLRPSASLSGGGEQGQGFLVLPCETESLMQSPSQQVYLVAHHPVRYKTKKSLWGGWFRKLGAASGHQAPGQRPPMWEVAWSAPGGGKGVAPWVTAP